MLKQGKINFYKNLGGGFVALTLVLAPAFILANCGGGGKRYAAFHAYSAGGGFGYDEKWEDNTHVFIRYTGKLERTKLAPEALENRDNVQKNSDEILRLALLRAAQLAEARRYPYIRLVKHASQIEKSQFSSSANKSAPPPVMSGGVVGAGGAARPLIIPSPTASDTLSGSAHNTRSEGYGYQIKTTIVVELLKSPPTDRKDDASVMSVQTVLLDGKRYLDEAAALGQ